MDPVRISELSTIEHELFTTQVSDLYRSVLVIRLSGEVRAGAAGTADARMMEAWVAFDTTAVAPDALVIDLGGLKLSGMLPRHVINPVGPNLEEGFPLYIVRPKAKDNLFSALPAESLCASVNEAFDRIREQGPWAIR